MKTRFRVHAHQIVNELSGTLDQISDEKAEELTELAINAERIFVAGCGRSGLAVKAFAMRLMHMGLRSHVLGETTTPSITDRDLFLIGSGSGATGSLRVMAEKARSIGSRIALVTIRADSPIARLADCVLTIPAPTPKIEGDTGFRSIQPMGSLFEQCLLLTLDALILGIMEKTGKDSAEMFKRHANLE